MILILYTTLYREGGPQFKRAAETLQKTKQIEYPGLSIECWAVESKRDFVDVMEKILKQGIVLKEFHFIGHAGMYGPMFRTTAMPEQFSPYEWKHLTLPMNAATRAYFHTCRSARFFAPFFSRTFNVVSYGYHLYTTVSRSPNRFVWEGFKDTADLYVMSCAGRKSHGYFGSLRKFLGLAKAERFIEFKPGPLKADPSYNTVAQLYDEAFADIGVRADECKWLEGHLFGSSKKSGLRVLDIGCGNGALLGRLSPYLAKGCGVDASLTMIETAAKRWGTSGYLEFKTVDSPSLPYPNQSFDAVISLLSFRYLDWDPLMNEMRRVLAPGGKILIVDMVTVPAKIWEWPRLLWDKLRTFWQLKKNRDFRIKLKKLVSHPDWKGMLNYNPIRAEHEYRWYLASRYPQGKLFILNRGLHNRVLAFDSGPLQPGWVPPQSYP
ncbi:class I SAM-dependent methyltransferase [bacterium]|nr:class I SAM-dependent methyltransferase [bacterium]